jgi:undecaprenyl-diphosphatase
MLDIIQAADAGALIFIQENLRVSFLTAIMIFYTTLGNNGLIWIGISLILLCFKKTRMAGLLALLAMLLGLLYCNLALKNIVSRPRPYLSVEGLLPLLPPPDPNSFPSGHTCAAFAAAGIWLRTLPKRAFGIAAVLAAAIMGFSRMYVGLHYPTDVLAGMFVDLFCAFLIWHIYLKIKTPENGKQYKKRSGF